MMTARQRLQWTFLLLLIQLETGAADDIENDKACPLLLTTIDNVKYVAVNKSVTPASYEDAKIILTKRDGYNFMAVTLDSINGYFFTSVFTGELFRAKFDGSSAENILEKEMKSYSPQTTVIPEENQLYTTHYFEGRINVSKMDGTQRTVLIDDEATKYVRGVAVDPIARLLFHTTSEPPRVFKSKLDGSNVMAIVTSDLASPWGLALDHLNTRLYWANKGKYVIEAVDYDGQNRIVVCKTSHSPRFLYIMKSITCTTIFWTESTETRIFWGEVDGSRKGVVFVEPTTETIFGVALFVEDCQTSEEVANFPRVLSHEVQWLKEENTLMFEVKTCSRIKMQLRNAHLHMAYELDFARSIDDDNIIRAVAIKTTIRKTSQFTQDCSQTRRFWVSWENNVISGGVGFNYGTKEVMRQSDEGERYGKVITLANVVTQPNDGNAEFAFYPASFLPVLDPPLSTEKCVKLIDNNTATCVVIAHTEMGTFLSSARRWTPQPQGACVHSGVTITRLVPDAIKASFTVKISGRHLVCSNSHISVAVRQVKWGHCETAGTYATCELSETTQDGNLVLSTCVATCTCNGDDCDHVTLHIPKHQEHLEICEIDI